MTSPMTVKRVWKPLQLLEQYSISQIKLVLSAIAQDKNLVGAQYPSIFQLRKSIQLAMLSLVFDIFVKKLKYGFN